jgi:hypothetical protein
LAIDLATLWPWD